MVRVLWKHALSKMARVSHCVGALCAFVFIFVSLEFSLPVEAKWVQSSIDTDQDWKFITRFCFRSEKGRFDFTFKYPTSYGIQQLLLYYDEPGQWESVYKTSKNCSQRRSVLSKANNQIIDLTDRYTGSRDAGCSRLIQEGQEYYYCNDSVTFRSARERWWYIVLARCEKSEGGKTGLKLEYTLHMMNGEADEFLYHELSADEFYIFPVDMAFFIAFFILLGWSIFCGVILFNRQMFHTTYKMYITSLSLWTFGVFLQSIAWGRYSDSGWPEKPTEVTGRLFLAASTTVFLLMLLLLAKGYTVTRGRLTQMSTVRLSIFFSLYVIINITLFIWEGMFFDEGYVLYFYESPPGYGLVAMRLVGWLWFLYGFIFTVKHNPNKALFYTLFFSFYTVCWFIAGPIVILTAIFSMPKWVREKTVNGVEQAVAFFGFLIFLGMTLPVNVNTLFPYHLRVSQVRFSDDDNDEPAESYGMSEESRQHLDSIFTVQPNGQPGTSSSSRSMGYSRAGYENGGYMKNGNGYNPALDATFITQRNGHGPPMTASAPLPPLGEGPPSYEEAAAPTGHRLPPLQGPRLPPLETSLPSPPLQNGDAHPPPPESEQELPPLQNGQQELPPLQNGQQELPPLQNRQPQLPPLTNGHLPPISASAPPPPADEDEDH